MKLIKLIGGNKTAIIVLHDIKMTYSKIIIVGFSVGATIAWRCSERKLYDGVICCYGSRIRDYLMVYPKCPALLVFAKYDSFDVIEDGIQLQNKENTAIEILEARHGFADFHSKNYSHLEAEIFNQRRKSFLMDCCNVLSRPAFQIQS